jgi:hypothetical protein
MYLGYGILTGQIIAKYYHVHQYIFEDLAIQILCMSYYVSKIN